MPYKRSAARKTFIADVAAVMATLKEAFSKKCTSVSVQDYALCSAVILTSAKIETYLETLISDWCKAIIANKVKTDVLPLNTRAFLLNDAPLENAYRKFVYLDDESTFLPEIGKLVRGSLFLFASDGQEVPTFQPSRIYAESKYPSPKNIKRLFRRCGIDPAFNRLNAVARTDVENLVTSFNDIRTEMAHQGMPVGLTAADVRARISGTLLTVRYIDRVFYSHVVKTTGAACWTT